MYKTAGIGSGRSGYRKWMDVVVVGGGVVLLCIVGNDGPPWMCDTGGRKGVGKHLQLDERDCLNI